MSRQKTDLRPSIVKMTIKSPVSSEKKIKDSLKPQASEISSRPGYPIQKNEKQDKSDQLLKEIEKWRQKFTASQKSLDECQTQSKLKDEQINALEQKIKAINAEYKKNLQSAKHKYGNHSECKTEIDNLKVLLSSKEKENDNLKSENQNIKTDYEFKLQSLIEQNKEEVEKLKKSYQEEKDNFEKKLESQILQLKKLHNEQMIAKDEKLKILKKQIADVLTGSSVERQQQIEELLKELKRVSEEAETVKAALKNMKGRGDSCNKCILYQKKCNELQEQIKIKDITLNDLMKIGFKMQKQISQQDDLVALWNKVKKENEKPTK